MTVTRTSLSNWNLSFVANSYISLISVLDFSLSCYLVPFFSFVDSISLWVFFTISLQVQWTHRWLTSRCLFSPSVTFQKQIQSLSDQTSAPRSRRESVICLIERALMWPSLRLEARPTFGRRKSLICIDSCLICKVLIPEFFIPESWNLERHEHLGN